MSERAKNIAGRVIRTAIETTLGFLITNVTIYDVDYKAAAGVIALATLTSLLYNIASVLPEDNYRKEIDRLKAINDGLTNK